MSAPAAPTTARAALAGTVALAMLAFAANSVLARLALGGGENGGGGGEAYGYTGARLVAGALALLAILRLRGGVGAPRRPAGSWAGAAALLLYALPFSVAYLRVGTGAGALVLFASVQAGILGWAVLKGDRPGALEWAGMALAFAALVALLAPGASAPDPFGAPDPLGAALMVVAGLAFAAYSLIGRGSASPLADTAGNFARLLPAGVALVIGGALVRAPEPRALGLAIASGALASGLGYAVWYAALPRLSRAGAACVQLTVPAIAAAGGVLLLGEPLTPRLALCSAGVLAGVALAVLAAERRRAAAG